MHLDLHPGERCDNPEGAIESTTFWHVLHQHPHTACSVFIPYSLYRTQTSLRLSPTSCTVCQILANSPQRNFQVNQYLGVSVLSDNELDCGLVAGCSSRSLRPGNRDKRANTVWSSKKKIVMEQPTHNKFPPFFRCVAPLR